MAGFAGSVVAYLGPLLLFLLLAVAVADRAGQPLGRALPVALLAAPLALYLGFWLGAAIAGYALLGLWALAGMGSLVLAARGNPPRRERLQKLLFTPALLAFVLFYTYLFWADRSRGFIWWDEISHWGPMVKETLRLDAFYAVPASNLGIHKDYPPFMCLFQTLWCRVSGGYSEGRLYCALLTFCHALFLPAFERIRGSRRAMCVKTVVACLLVLLANSVFCGDVPFYASIYTDYVLALLMAYGLAMPLLHPGADRFTAAETALAATAVLMVKQMGLAFYLMIAGFLLAVVVAEGFWALRKKQSTPTAQLKSGLWQFLPTALLPLLFRKSWAAVLARWELAGEGQFEFSALQFGRLINIYKLTDGKDFQQAAAHNFVSALFKRNLWAAGAGKIELSYMQIFLLFAVLLALFTWLARRQFPLQRLVLMDLVALGGSGCYALVMLLLYVFSFGSYEGPNLASYSRYMNTYWFGLFALLTLLTLAALQKLTDKHLLCAALAAGFVLSAELAIEQPGNLNNLLPSTTPGDSARFTAQADRVAAATPEDSAVFVVTQQGNGYENFIMQYLLLPRNINDKNYSVGQTYYPGDLWTMDLNPDDYAEILAQSDYVYILAADDEYRSTYGDLFPTPPQTDDLYRVTDTDPLVLEKVE